jgi:hypothetical protein
VAKNSGLPLAVDANKTCANPICQGPINDLPPPSNRKVWRRTPRKFCSKRCKTEGWILATAAKLLMREVTKQDFPGGVMTATENRLLRRPSDR